MTTPLWRRRRADRFAQLLDEADGGRRQRLRSPLDDELGGLMTVRHQLVDTAPLEIDPEFRAGLRAMLMATAEREGIGATAEPEPDPRPRRSSRTAGVLVRGPRARTAVVAGVAVGAVAFAGVSTASENAVPGDALYGVKRSTERAQLALASSDVGRAQLYLDFAHTRLAEAHSVDGGLDRVLDDMDQDTLAGVKLLTTAAADRRDPAALGPIDRFVTDQRRALEQLEADVTDADRTRVDTSLQLLDGVEKRATELRRNLDLDCPSAASIDALGPLPGVCVALPAPNALDPAPQEGPDGQSEPGGTGESAPSPDDQSGSDEADPPAARGGDESPADPGAAPDEAPDAADDAAGDEPATEEEEEPEDDGGLLNGLNRLLGNLLGG